MENFKKYFNFFENNKDVIYLDTAATSIKLTSVLDREHYFNSHINSSTHSIHHKNGLEALSGVNKTRNSVKKFINAKSEKEIVFNSGTTEGLNTVIFGVCANLKKGDIVLTTLLEHSSVIIPLLECSKRYGFKIKYMNLDSNDCVEINDLKKSVNEKVKFVAFASTPNTISITNDIGKVVKAIKSINKETIVLVDCAQSVAHTKTDVVKWDVDFISFSGHKLYGPWGIGVLYGKESLLNKLEPLMYGGGSIYDNDKESFELLNSPERFEAGTQNMSAIYSFNEAFEFYNKFSIDKIHNHEKELKKYLVEKISKEKLENKFKFHGLNNDGPILLIDTIDVSPHDFVNFLDKKYKIVVRSGKHCAANSKNVTKFENATIRVSFGIYNTFEDIDILINALKDKDSWKEFLF